jgi:formylglycine-generating enzyme required for sulfatase activity
VRRFQAITEQRPDYEDAVAKLRQAEHQRDLARLYVQAQAAQEAGDWPAAIPILEELVSRAPDYKDAAALLETAAEQVQLASLYAQAQQLQAAGHWQAVMNILAEIHVRAPDYPGSQGLLAAAEKEWAEERRRTMAHDLYLRAGRAMEAEQWEEARELLAQVRGMEPGYRETERLLARAEAEATAQRQQADLAARYDQAQAARKAGDWSRAVSELETLLAEAPGFEQAAALLEELKTSVPASGEPRLFDGREMVYVPAGSFWMGSDEGEEKGYGDERPRHEVFVPGFWIDRTPVTNEEYQRFVEATGHQTTAEAEGRGHVWTGSDWKKVRRADWRHPTGRRSNIKDKADHPVVLVSWHDVVAYCQWRSEATGAPIRLPTEAEWEKAARGIDGWRYPWGDEFDASKCNSAEDGTGDTMPVGYYSPEGDSPYGLVDMAGNVWEWTCSLYKPYPYRAQDGREDPRADGARVVRGGSWDYGRRNVRTASRNRYVPSFAHNLVGFRCACSTSRGEAEATPPQAYRRRKPTDLPEEVLPPGGPPGESGQLGPRSSPAASDRPRSGRLPEESGPRDQ